MVLEGVLEHHLLHHILAYLGAAVVAVPLFRRLGLGAILGYLFAGAVIGPQGLHVIEHPEHALHFAEFGVVMLLFIIGLELNPEKLWRMRAQITLLGGGQLLASALVIAAVVILCFGFAWKSALLVGLTLALSSTAFAVQLMDEQGIMGVELGRKGFSILLLQDLAVIPILLLVSMWAPSVPDAQGLPWWFGPAAVVAALFFGRFAINPLLKVVALYGSREVLTAAALLIVLGYAVLMQSVELSMGMGAFLAGIILANSSYRHQLETDIEPFKGLLLGLFFIALGMTLDLALFVQAPVFIIALALALMAVKTLVITLLLHFKGGQTLDGLRLGLMLSQGGEFAFVVMGKASGLGLFSESVVNYCVLVVGVSMALTSPALMLFKFFTQKTKEESTDYDQNIASENDVIIAGFGRFGQIVGRILSANGQTFTALDKDASHVEFVKQFGNQIFFGDAGRIDLLEAAGIRHAGVLVIAIDDVESSVAIAREVKEHYPEINILARAHNRMHMYQLLEVGVTEIVRETFESGLVAAQSTLEHIGYTESQAINKIKIFREHDEALVQRAVEHRGDTDKLVTIAKEGRKELEALFRQDDRF